MNNIENLTLANLTWIKEVAIPTSKKRITSEHLDVVMRAKSLILGTPPEQVSCFSCSARAYFKVCESVLDQYGQQILDRITELESVQSSVEETPLDQVYEEASSVTSPTQDSPNPTHYFVDQEADVQPTKKTRKKKDEDSSEGQ